jgi:hypothetical protein
MKLFRFFYATFSRSVLICRVGLMLFLLTMVTPVLGEASLRMGSQNSGFVYDALSPLRYDDLKQAWFYQHPHATPTPQVLEALAMQAFYEASSTTPLWKPLTHWRLVGGAHPWVIVPRVQVENTDPTQAVLNASVTARISVDYGIWYPEAQGAMTNIKQLTQNQKRQFVTQYETSLDVFARQDAQVKTLAPIALMPLLKSHPDRFPNAIYVELTLQDNKRMVQKETLTLKLYPDLFALPLYFY